MHRFGLNTPHRSGGGGGLENNDGAMRYADNQCRNTMPCGNKKSLHKRTIAVIPRLGTLLAVLVLVVTPSFALAGGPARKTPKWCGLHLIVVRSDKDLDILAGQLPKLARLGVNVLILEVDYNFHFQSHPEL